MLPEGADAVVMLEYTAEHPDGTLEVRRAVAPGENVLTPGEDVPAGKLLFRRPRASAPRRSGSWRPWELPVKGLSKTPGGHYLLRRRNRPRGRGSPAPARCGTPTPIWPRPRCPRAAACPCSWGSSPTILPRLRAALAAAGSDADLILISGGSSVGARDLTLTAIQDLPGSEVLVHGVAIRPGKPTILAAVDLGSGSGAQAPPGAAGPPGLRRGGHGGPGPAAAARLAGPTARPPGAAP